MLKDTPVSVRKRTGQRCSVSSVVHRYLLLCRLHKSQHQLILVTTTELRVCDSCSSDTANDGRGSRTLNCDQSPTSRVGKEVPVTRVVSRVVAFVVWWWTSAPGTGTELVFAGFMRGPQRHWSYRSQHGLQESDKPVSTSPFVPHELSTEDLHHILWIWYGHVYCSTVLVQVLVESHKEGQWLYCANHFSLCSSHLTCPTPEVSLCLFKADVPGPPWFIVGEVVHPFWEELYYLFRS